VWVVLFLRIRRETRDGARGEAPEHLVTTAERTR
jgi:hypothetical protein